MPLAKCRECGKRVSTEAMACPHCGCPDPASRRSEPAASSHCRSAPPSSGAPAEISPKQETAEAATQEQVLRNEATDALPITVSNIPKLNAVARHTRDSPEVWGCFTVLFGLYMVYAGLQGASVLGYGVGVLATTGVVVALAGAALCSERWAWSPVAAVLVLVPAGLIWFFYRVAFGAAEPTDWNAASSVRAVLTAAPFYLAWKAFRSRHTLRHGPQVKPSPEAEEAVKRVVKYLKGARFDNAQDVIEFEERGRVLFRQCRAALLGDVFAVIDASGDFSEPPEFFARDSVRFEFRRPEKNSGYADMWAWMSVSRRRITIPQASLARYEAWKGQTGS